MKKKLNKHMTNVVVSYKSDKPNQELDVVIKAAAKACKADSSGGSFGDGDRELSFNFENNDVADVFRKLITSYFKNLNLR